MMGTTSVDVKKIVFALLLILVFSPVAGANKPIKNSPDGFRGIKWGDPLSALGKTDGHVYEEPVFGFKLYSRVDEDLSFGSAQLSSVSYAFWKGQFINVGLHCKTPSDFPAMKAAAIERFGKPVKPDGSIEKYIWQDENVLITLEQNSPKMMIYFLPLLKKCTLEQEPSKKKLLGFPFEMLG